MQLKTCEIVQQITPPETSQCNYVSERSNRTLLDSVRSTKSLTKLSHLIMELDVRNL